MTWDQFNDFNRLAKELRKSLAKFSEVYKEYYAADYCELVEISPRFSLGVECVNGRAGNRQGRKRELAMY